MGVKSTTYHHFSTMWGKCYTSSHPISPFLAIPYYAKEPNSILSSWNELWMSIAGSKNFFNRVSRYHRRYHFICMMRRTCHGGRDLTRFFLGLLFGVLYMAREAPSNIFHSLQRIDIVWWLFNVVIVSWQHRFRGLDICGQGHNNILGITIHTTTLNYPIGMQAPFLVVNQSSETISSVTGKMRRTYWKCEIFEGYPVTIRRGARTSICSYIFLIFKLVIMVFSWKMWGFFKCTETILSIVLHKNRGNKG